MRRCPGSGLSAVGHSKGVSVRDQSNHSRAQRIHELQAKMINIIRIFSAGFHSGRNIRTVWKGSTDGTGGGPRKEGSVGRRNEVVS